MALEQKLETKRNELLALEEKLSERERVSFLSLIEAGFQVPVALSVNFLTIYCF